MLEFVSRQGSRSLKYDALIERFGRDGLLPLWVADMDCRAPKVLQEAIMQRIEHGVYGYSSAEQMDASKNAVCRWLSSRHSISNLEQQDCLIFAGVLEALAVCIEIFCDKNEAIILNSPAYNNFYSTIESSGRAMIESNLGPDGLMDLEFLEHQIKHSLPKPRIFLLCSPHNPVGKVWTRKEIEELLCICQKYQLYLISDEIHFDLIYSGVEHLSILRSEFVHLYDQIILISAPSKTFNIPALRSAYVVSKNLKLLQQIRHFCNQFQIGQISLFAHVALEACYTQPEAIRWLEELLLYLERNRDMLHDYLSKEFPELHHYKPDATYLYWVDCRHFLHGNPDSLRKFFLDAGLALGWGDWYHGDGYVRINFSCAQSLLKQALRQWKQAYKNLC